VHWPRSGRVQHFAHVTANRYYELQEGQQLLEKPYGAREPGRAVQR